MNNRRSSTPDRSEREDEILRSLRRVIRAVDLYSRKLIIDFGLSGPQLMCLKVLDQQGSLSTGELAAEMSLTAATVCGILDRLEGRELIVRERQLDDKRRVNVRLSAAGRAVIERAPPSLQERFVTKLRSMPDRDQSELQRSLHKLVGLMSAEDLDAAPILAPGQSVVAESPRQRVDVSQKRKG
jgi:DNA-binding MarR family transcriptional regulator